MNTAIAPKVTFGIDTNLTQYKFDGMWARFNALEWLLSYK